MITGKILGNYCVINGRSADASGRVPDMSADIYYEVIRLIDGKLLFLPDHLARLQKSASGSGITYPDNRQIIDSLSLLIRSNSFREGNIRICLQKSNGNEAAIQCYFIPYFYPDPDMYKKGVLLSVYPHLRNNPGIKKWDDQFRNSVSRYILDQKVYEAALLNPDHQITEGSRSNIFFIDRQGVLSTAPELKVLPGITRKYVMEIARLEGIPIQERLWSLAELDQPVSVFISGTSPKVLPVKQIDHHIFDADHPLLHMLMDRFEGMVQEHLTPV